MFHRCSQYLGVKVTYFGEKTLQVLRVLAVFRVCAHTASTRSFSSSVLRILPDSQVFGVRYCAYALFFKYFEGSALLVMQVLAVFRPLVLRVLRVLAVPKHSQYAQYAQSTKYTWTICTPFP